MKQEGGKMEIKFYDENENVKQDLFSKIAEDYAKEIANEGRDRQGKLKKNALSQVRKFYDEVLKFKMKLQQESNKFDDLLPYIKMLNAKAVYAQGRDHVTKGFVNFIRMCIEQVKTKKDFEIFTDFFEAFMGFYKYEAEKKERGRR